jgi:hypothetical protein
MACQPGAAATDKVIGIAHPVETAACAQQQLLDGQLFLALLALAFESLAVSSAGTCGAGSSAAQATLATGRGRTASVHTMFFMMDFTPDVKTDRLPRIQNHWWHLSSNACYGQEQDEIEHDKQKPQCAQTWKAPG